MLLRIKLLEIHFKRVSNWLWLVDQSGVKKKYFELNLGRMTKTVFSARPVSDVVSLSRLRARRTECQVESRRSIMTRKGEQHLEKTVTLCYQASAVRGFRPRRPGFRKSLFPSLDSWYQSQTFVYQAWGPKRKLGRLVTSIRTGKGAARSRTARTSWDVLRGPDPTYRFLTYLTTLIKSIGVIWASFGKIKIEFPFLSKCPSNI